MLVPRDTSHLNKQSENLHIHRLNQVWTNTHLQETEVSRSQSAEPDDHRCGLCARRSWDEPPEGCVMPKIEPVDQRGGVH